MDLWRSSVWAGVIDQTLKADPSGDGRMVVYGGSFHFGHDTEHLDFSDSSYPRKSVSDLLPQYESTVIGVSGGEGIQRGVAGVDPSVDKEPPALAEDALSKEDPGTEVRKTDYFMYRYRQQGARRVDAIIHVPDYRS
jgi:hypothetical protein